MDSTASGTTFRSRQDRILEPILCGRIRHSPPSGDTPCYHPAGQKASAHALLDGCGWAPTVPSPTLFNRGASAEVTPGRGELPALVSMLLANYCDGEALHVYQPSLPPADRHKGTGLLRSLNQNQFVIESGRHEHRGVHNLSSIGERVVGCPATALVNSCLRLVAHAHKRDEAAGDDLG